MPDVVFDDARVSCAPVVVLSVYIGSVVGVVVVKVAAMDISVAIDVVVVDGGTIPIA